MLARFLRLIRWRRRSQILARLAEPNPSPSPSPPVVVQRWKQPPMFTREYRPRIERICATCGAKFVESCPLCAYFNERENTK